MLTNEMLVNRLENHSKMIIRMINWHVSQHCNNRLVCFSNIIKKTDFQ